MLERIIQELKEKYFWAPLILIAVLIVIFLFFKIVVPAMSPSSKGATSLIEESTNGEYWRDLIDAGED